MPEAEMGGDFRESLRGVKTFFLCRAPFKKRGAGAWVARGAFIDYRPSVSLGARARIGQGCRVAAGTGEVVLGDDVLLHPYVIIGAGGRGGSVRIGNRSTINSFACLYGFGGLTIGDDVIVGPGATLVAQTHDFARTDIPIKDQGSSGRGARIGNGVWIGARAVILDGVTVGEGAIVGAGAVVTRDVAPYDIVVGNPARVIRNRKHQES